MTIAVCAREQQSDVRIWDPQAARNISIHGKRIFAGAREATQAPIVIYTHADNYSTESSVIWEAALSLDNNLIHAG